MEIKFVGHTRKVEKRRKTRRKKFVFRSAAQKPFIFDSRNTFLWNSMRTYNTYKHTHDKMIVQDFVDVFLLFAICCSD